MTRISAPSPQAERTGENARPIRARRKRGRRTRASGMMKRGSNRSWQMISECNLYCKCGAVLHQPGRGVFLKLPPSSHAASGPAGAGQTPEPPKERRGFGPSPASWRVLQKSDSMDSLLQMRDGPREKSPAGSVRRGPFRILFRPYSLPAILPQGGRMPFGELPEPALQPPQKPTAFCQPNTTLQSRRNWR